MFKEDILLGKTAYISGGTSGINLGIALTLARHGANIAIIGRDLEKAERAADTIRSAAPTVKVLCFSADVRDYDAIEDTMKQTSEQLGQLDIVIAGAAGNFFAPAVSISPKGFKTVVDIDLMGTFHVFRAGFDYCKKTTASFIAITAPQAVNATPLQAHVCAAKAGVNALLKTLAMEWGPSGIRVNGIAPGLTGDTEGLKRLFATDPDGGQKMIDALPIRRLGSVDDIGAAAIYLSSPLGAYVNGTVLDVDGGYQIGDASLDCLSPTR
ncbi:SDR family oxidoreductase [Zhongshania aliphaticivorans]|uniref:Short-chain dehydrogenase n=1 Tax=Zhongshania aliphaticivorans TaxID=1470434 RepID=A0A127M1J8_9GAMM|nr:SDR family oxidoreductase [Zhongshania aliphaticivorans]AMO67104.1 short-chain dehydrogenase [Zhongshania aliphaticivorans]